MVEQLLVVATIVDAWSGFLVSLLQQRPSGRPFFGDQSKNLLVGCKFEGGGNE